MTENQISYPAKVPISDVDSAMAFYVDQVGFGAEQDLQVDQEHRFVELPPPGSPCSIALTTGDIDSQPGSLKGVQLNVEDVNEVHAFLRDRGVAVSEIQDYPWGRFCFSPISTATAGQSTNHRRMRPVAFAHSFGYDAWYDCCTARRGP